jgi:hypothetical protein
MEINTSKFEPLKKKRRVNLSGRDEHDVNLSGRDEHVLSDADGNDID